MTLPSLPLVLCSGRTQTQNVVPQEQRSKDEFPPPRFWGFWDWLSALLRFKDANEPASSSEESRQPRKTGRKPLAAPPNQPLTSSKELSGSVYDTYFRTFVN